MDPDDLRVALIRDALSGGPHGRFPPDYWLFVLGPDWESQLEERIMTENEPERPPTRTPEETYAERLIVGLVVAALIVCWGCWWFLDSTHTVNVWLIAATGLVLAVMCVDVRVIIRRERGDDGTDDD